jgi:hypothetical protein
MQATGRRPKACRRIRLKFVQVQADDTLVFQLQDHEVDPVIRIPVFVDQLIARGSLTLRKLIPGRLGQPERGIGSFVRIGKIQRARPPQEHQLFAVRSPNRHRAPDAEFQGKATVTRRRQDHGSIVRYHLDPPERRPLWIRCGRDQNQWHSKDATVEHTETSAPEPSMS